MFVDCLFIFIYLDVLNSGFERGGGKKGGGWMMGGG
jgi:hypothetical protein